MRYLDSRDDEQARGITMKSSSISLLYVPGAAFRPDGPRSCSEEEKAARGAYVASSASGVDCLATRSLSELPCLMLHMVDEQYMHVCNASHVIAMYVV